MICTALIREVKAKAIELWEDCGEGCSYKKATEPPHAGAFGSLVSDIFQVPVDLRRSRVCVCVCFVAHRLQPFAAPLSLHCSSRVVQTKGLSFLGGAEG